MKVFIAIIFAASSLLAQKNNISVPLNCRIPGALGSDLRGNLICQNMTTVIGVPGPQGPAGPSNVDVIKNAAGSPWLSDIYFGPPGSSPAPTVNIGASIDYFGNPFYANNGAQVMCPDYPCALSIVAAGVPGNQQTGPIAEEFNSGPFDAYGPRVLVRFGLDMYSATGGTTWLPMVPHRSGDFIIATQNGCQNCAFGPGDMIFDQENPATGIKFASMGTYKMQMFSSGGFGIGTSQVDPGASNLGVDGSIVIGNHATGCIKLSSVGGVLSTTQVSC